MSTNISPILRERPILTMKETMDLLRISRATLYRLMDAGTIPYTKVASHRRIRRADLELYLESGFQKQEPA